MFDFDIENQKQRERKKFAKWMGIAYVIALILIGWFSACGSIETTERNEDVAPQVMETVAPVTETATEVPSSEEPAVPETKTEDVAVEPAVTDTPVHSEAEAPAQPVRPAYLQDEVTADAIIDLGDIRLYDFADNGYTGVGADGKTVLNYEAYIGTKTVANGTIVAYESYDNTKGGSWTATSAELALHGEVSKAIAVNGTIDFADKAVGAYDITVTFRHDGMQDRKPVVTVLWDGTRVWSCKRTTGSEKVVMSQRERLDYISEMIAYFGEPSDFLSVDEITYPNPAIPEWGWNCDTERWQGLAREITANCTDKSDMVKVIALHDWMTRNLSYDRYNRNNLDCCREHENHDFSGKWSVWTIRTGVCKDFANIFAILCRENGIPCVTLGSSSANHAWNAVFVDGKWLEVDLTDDIRRVVYGEDTTDVSGTKTICYDAYLRGLSTRLTSVNGGLFTYEHCTSGFVKDNLPKR